MNNNESIQISEFDVLCFLEDKPLDLPRTVRFVELKQRMEERLFHYKSDKPLMDKGVECELLKPSGQGWQKGKVKICVEFIPDKLNYSSELDVLRSRVIEQEVSDLLDEPEVQ
jgi:hypothetical protein